MALTFPAVAKGAQDLSGFKYTPASLNYGAPAPTLSAPAPAEGAALSYASAPTDVCTVDAATGALTLHKDGACTVTVAAAATTNYNAATAPFEITVNPAGALILAVDSITGDDTVNIAERAAGFAIRGATGTEAGVGVSVTLGTQPALTATSAIAAGATAATWSVTVAAAAAYITGTSVALTVTAAKTGYTSPAAVSRTLAVDLTAPAAPGYTAPASLTVGTAITALSPTGASGIAAYSAAGLPAGLSIDATSGVIAGAPTTAASATAAVTLTVTDTAGNTDTTGLTFPAVAKGAQDLSGFKYTPASLNYGAPAPTLSAPAPAEGAALSYASAPTDVCTVDAATGALTLHKDGACTVTVAAAATTNYNAATAPFEITVNPAGALILAVDSITGDDTVNIAERAAGFAIRGATGTEAGVGVSVTLGTQPALTATSAIAAGATAATWSVTVAAAAAYITGTSVALTVTAAKTGYTSPAAVSRTLAVDLTAPAAPGYTAPASLTVGTAITALSPTGASGIAAYSAAGLPAGLSIDATSGVIAGAPTTAASATAAVTLTVTDTAGQPGHDVALTFPAVAKGAQDLSGFKYTPASLNYGAPAPTLSAPAPAEGAALSYASAPTDVCTVDAATGALTLHKDGACTVTVAAAATTNYNAATAPFEITVNPAGALILAVDSITGDDTVNIAERAAGFAIRGATGTEAGVGVSVTLGTQPALTATSAIAAGATAATWSVTVAAAAAYITGTSVALTVTAAKTGYTSPAAVSRTLAVDLTAPAAPGYTAPASLTVGTAITALSPTGASGIAAYSAAGLPAGLSIDATSGVIAGAPTTAASATAAVTLTVTDTAGNTDTTGLTFPAVAKGAQDLSGFKYTPASLNYGAPAPTLSAPAPAEGAALSYASAPTDVCTVDAATGALTLHKDGACTVTVAAAATTNYNAATAPFEITVNPAGALILAVDSITGDDTVNIAERAAGFAIRGATGTEAGVGVSVTLGTQPALTATSAIAAGATAATWSVTVAAAAAYITGTSVALTVTAAKTGYTSPAAVSRTLAVDLTAPAAPGYTAPASLTVGTAITALSPTGASGIAAYSAAGLPAGLSIDATSGVIAGAPTTAASATAAVTLTVTDTAGNTDTTGLTFPAVAKGAQDLSGFKYTPASLNYGAPAPTLSAPAPAEGAALSYASAPTDVCTVDAATGALTLHKDGACTVTVAAAATTNYNAATAPFEITVNPAGALILAVDSITGDDTVNIAERAAGFAIRGATGTEAGVGVSVTLGTQPALTATSAIAAGATAATWSVTVAAAAAYITGTSVALTVTAAKTGYTSPAAVSRTLAVDLTAPAAPGYTAPASLTVGTAITALSPTGASGIAAYSAAGLPAGLSIDATSGVIAGAPTTAASATAAVTLTVTDTAGQPGHGGAHLPGGGQGRPGPVRLQIHPGQPQLRRPGPDPERAGAGGGRRAELRQRPHRRVHGGRRHGGAHPA